MSYTCPVCAFPGLTESPYEADTGGVDEKCPSCGIEFGYDDFAGTDDHIMHQVWREWRTQWIKKGMPWSGEGKAPVGWDPKEQLQALNV